MLPYIYIVICLVLATLWVCFCICLSISFHLPTVSPRWAHSSHGGPTTFPQWAHTLAPPTSFSLVTQKSGGFIHHFHWFPLWAHGGPTACINSEAQPFSRENYLVRQTVNIKPVLELKANCNKTFLLQKELSFHLEAESFYNTDTLMM